MPKQKKVTLKEIAERTGVSMGTVHRAIYGKSGIGEETRQRILEEVARSNYQIDEAASVLKRSAKTIAVVLPKAQKEDRFYFRGIWRGIREAAQGMEQYKLDFQCIESEFPLSQIWRELERVYDDKVEELDGLITIADSKEADIWIERYAKRGIPVILLSSNYEKQRSSEGLIECIRVDHRRSGRLAAEFMSYGLGKYQGKVMVVGGNSEIFSVQIHGSSFEQEILKYHPEREVIRMKALEDEQAKESFLEALRREKIAAIFACSARNTYLVCRLLEQENRGQDMLLVGTDVFEELIPYYEDGTLNATVCQYHWEQGTSAVQRMYEHLSKGLKMQDDEMLPSSLILKNNYPCFMNKSREWMEEQGKA
ncbi:MAG: LacI family DNA-binding transcriptional regulator [Candidatus Limivivens sp.]|nr:LacI family DNA-binding transcriptional regulator [Candidatus Limivivens sp.]